ncbi:carbamoyl phosphate synthase small subunit [Geomicrobium sp. JCM 19039]|uniref:carbamoyl phosphate synthase small subunit n=1 Tax=Geomicrobium sp. JCM 19039 TaxID=1460636 RepID=UPI00045F1F4F|nr:carbamoyl phosphate synthase small subunit [Geomicrobium sp. JCM 19039]GAK11834.1 carbamoyl-phosphate synthase small chain [Geomicrobium sp. JCM 19039]
MKGYIVLENGDVFTGEMAGQQNEVYGEAVFFTGMTGYQEVVTDPSYRGQIVVFTYPLIGNYGMQDHTDQSDEWQPKAIIVGECSPVGHHHLSYSSLTDVADQHDVPILTGVDTRAIVKTIRSEGAMGAVITTNPDVVDWSNYSSIESVSYVPDVSTKSIEQYGGGSLHIGLYDFGHKNAMVKELSAFGAKVTVLPYDTPFDTVKSMQFDGVLFSNGPGDPKQLLKHLDTYKQVAIHHPTFAICLGHQLMALAFGADTKKLKFGHRGANQPVIDLQTGKVDMTAQNHGFVVDEQSIDQSSLVVTHENVNDQSIEGLKHHELPIMTVQYHPEASPGPKDSHPLFHRFFQMIQTEKEVTLYA